MENVTAAIVHCVVLNPESGIMAHVLVSALQRQRQVNLREFKANLDYIVRAM